MDERQLEELAGKNHFTNFEYPEEREARELIGQLAEAERRMECQERTIALLLEALEWINAPLSEPDASDVSAEKRLAFVGRRALVASKLPALLRNEATLSIRELARRSDSHHQTLYTLDRRLDAALAQLADRATFERALQRVRRLMRGA